MSELSVLIELQSVHDNLRTIQRDLSAFPPDLANLDAELKNLAKRIEETAKGLAASRSLFASLSVELGGAEKAEEVAKASVKGATQKTQYTTFIASEVRASCTCQLSLDTATRPATPRWKNASSAWRLSTAAKPV